MLFSSDGALLERTALRSSPRSSVRCVSGGELALLAASKRPLVSADLGSAAEATGASPPSACVAYVHVRCVKQSPWVSSRVFSPREQLSYRAK